MPVKRRVTKGRTLDELKIVELLEGPGSCLLAGCGYYLPHEGPGALPGVAGGFWWELPAEAQQVVLNQMRADWRRFGAVIMQTAEGEPLALREFGSPGGTP